MLKVHHLNCGTMCPTGGRFLDGRSGGLGSQAKLICHVLLVETERDGLVLVDSGLGLEDVRHTNRRLGRSFAMVVNPRLKESETAIRQVEALGYAASDVRHVVLTHMDLDHAGGLSDFPHATVHLHRPEKEAVDHPRGAERQRYRPVQWAHAPRFETYDPMGEPWFGFACVRELRGLPADILIVPLHGHTRGHSGVAVDAEGGWLLHAGDAYFHANEMLVEAPSCPPGLAWLQKMLAVDRRQCAHNKRRLRELVRDHGSEVRVFSAHDVSELDALR